jgi:hypothetical protein
MKTISGSVNKHLLDDWYARIGGVLCPSMGFCHDLICHININMHFCEDLKLIVLWVLGITNGRGRKGLMSDSRIPCGHTHELF